MYADDDHATFSQGDASSQYEDHGGRGHYDQYTYESSSISEYESISSNIRSQRALLKKIKQLDRGYHDIPSNSIKTSSNPKKSSGIEFYETMNIPGNLIRNAVTGLRETGYKVGTKDEDLFFKVSYSAGYTNSQNPHVLFYQTPEEWETHFNTICHHSIKEKWQKKYYQEFQLRQEVQEPVGNTVIH